MSRPWIVAKALSVPAYILGLGAMESSVFAWGFGWRAAWPWLILGGAMLVIAASLVWNWKA